MSASVKIMLSYDYCHFEVCKSTDENITDEQINEMRKDVQRLCDKAVQQFKIAKDMSSKRMNGKYTMLDFKNQCLAIEEKKEEDRTVKEIAMLKQFSDENWQAQFEYNYDYEDNFDESDDEDY